MLSWILSTILYLATIAFGFYLDFGLNPGKGKKSAARFMKWRRVYLVWLYIFLCFGYMTGADWRNYELVYENGDEYAGALIRFLAEPASWALFSFMPKIIPDFILISCLAKCAYLFSAYKLTSAMTDKWASALALLIPLKLGFILIQNPFRFMLALIFINFALYYLYLYLTDPARHTSKTVLIIMVNTIVAVLFHTSCIVFIALIPLSFLIPKIRKVNPGVLFIIYLVFVILTSSLSLINSLKQGAIGALQEFMEMGDYANYEIEDGSSLRLVINPLQIIFCFFILYSRDKICHFYKNGSVVYGFAVAYCFLTRLFIMIPTGFRLALPYSVFYVVFIIFMLRPRNGFVRPVSETGSEMPRQSARPKVRRPSSFRFPVKLCAQLMVIYSLLSFGNKVWTRFEFIPYSNSIPYFFIGHKSYDERDQYNLKAYQARFGRTFDLKRDEN